MAVVEKDILLWLGEFKSWGKESVSLPIMMEHRKRTRPPLDACRVLTLVPPKVLKAALRIAVQKI